MQIHNPNKRRLLDENKTTNAKAKILDLLLMLDVGPLPTGSLTPILKHFIGLRVPLE